MSAFFSTLSCCWFWLLLGILLGWLLNRWLCKCCCKTSHSMADKSPTPSHTSTPSKLVETAAPVAAVPIAAAATASKALTVIDIAAAKAAGFALKNANDLTIVEGIGPKINELFHSNGIKTFAELANTSQAQMRAILDTGGSRFRIANPSTWAQQAALAAENKWAELKKLQDKLSGGVKK